MEVMVQMYSSHKVKVGISCYVKLVSINIAYCLVSVGANGDSNVRASYNGGGGVTTPSGKIEH
jgi:hypothetical protein